MAATGCPASATSRDRRGRSDRGDRPFAPGQGLRRGGRRRRPGPLPLDLPPDPLERPAPASPGLRASPSRPKADAAYLVGAREIAGFAIDAPHPEITWKTLFGKVWYEGYDQPGAGLAVVRPAPTTSSPSSRLTPLLVGTLKGTLYSLLLAIPLGILGAMYLSQFMHPAYKRYIKPMIEIMAALPSVVLGFLAGLWLAPRLEQAMPALLLMALFLPAAVLARRLALEPAAPPLAQPPCRPAPRSSPSSSPWSLAGLGRPRARPLASSARRSAATSRPGCSRPPACPTTSATPSSWASPWASR